MKPQICKNRPEQHPEQKTICIIQLTRFGDLIQSMQAISSLADNEDENIKIILVARKKFSAPLKFLIDKYFDTVHEIDINETLDLTSPLTIDSILSKQQEQITKISNENIDVLINLSFCKTSSYLSSLINARFKLGLTIDNFGKTLVTDEWSQYIYSSVMSGPFNPFSIVDLFRSIIGPEKSLINTEKAKQENYITIHPFASIDRKKWKPQKWAEIILKLLRDHEDLVVKVVGSKEEIEDSQKLLENPTIQKYANRINNFVGKTSLPEVYSILEKSKLFIGHDSMVGHMASLTGIQSVTVALGSVRPHETTPYGNNNYVIAPKTKCFPCFPDEECSYYQCHTDITYNLVCEAINQLLNNQEINKETLDKNVSTFHMASSRLYRTEISEINFQKLTEITDQEMSAHKIFMTFYRILWPYYLNEQDEKVDIPQINARTYTKLKTYISGIKNLYELSEFGKKYSKYILQEISKQSPNVKIIQDHSSKIDEIDKLTVTIKENFPLLIPLINFNTLKKANLSGDTIVQIAESSYLNFNELSTFCSIIYELSEKTISEYNNQTNIKQTQTK